MQMRTLKQLPAVLTVSHNSKIDINAQMHVPLDRLTVVPVGVDHTVFRPYDDVVKKKGRLMVTSSSDVPMKGLVPLLEAIAKLRAERGHRSHRHRQAPAEGSRRVGAGASRSHRHRDHDLGRQ